jgi:signal transduction histidine kinase/FixJ family two-component response regulator
MSGNVRLRQLIPALIALSTVTYGLVVSAINTRNNLRDSREVTYSRDLILTLQETLRSLLDLEIEHRESIIAADVTLPQSYQTTLRNVEWKTAALTALTRNHPTHHAKTRVICDAIKQREEAILLTNQKIRNHDPDAGIREIKSGASRAQTEHILELIDAMHAEELAMLNFKKKKLEESLRKTNLTLFIADGAAIVAGSLCAASLILFLSARDREQHLRMQKEKAEEADRAKTEFLAMMSHEIRTPMNAILGFGELLNDSVKTPKEKHFAGAILSSGNALLSLINDILDLSKVEAGKLEIQPEPVLISSFVESIETLFSFRAAEKGLEFFIHIEPDTPTLLYFDSLRLRQVMINLVGNAIKFTHSGSILVYLKTLRDSSNKITGLFIEVSDTGIGIAEDELPEIFRSFYQVDSIHTRQFQGTGLGLSISQRLAEAMGGTISAQSTLNEGSTFRVEIPIHHENASNVIPRDLPERMHQSTDFSLLTPSKILIADDQPITRELIKGFLAGSPHHIFEAENGKQAVDLSLKLQPDIIFMDLLMPVMDGREAASQLRAREETGHIPVIAITASSGIHDLENTTGQLPLFDGFIEKPFSKHRVLSEMANFIPLTAPALHASTTSPVHSQKTAPLQVDGKWHKLCQELDIIHHGDWPELAKLVPAQATIRFASQIAEIAKDHACSTLMDFSSDLMNAAEAMDFQESSRIVRSFPSIISKLRAHHD